MRRDGLSDQTHRREQSLRRDSGSPQGEHIIRAVNSLPSSQMESEKADGLSGVAEAAHGLLETPLIMPGLIGVITLVAADGPPERSPSGY